MTDTREHKKSSKETQREILIALKDKGNRGLTVAEVSAKINRTKSLARTYLERLLEKGYLVKKEGNQGILVYIYRPRTPINLDDVLDSPVETKVLSAKSEDLVSLLTGWSRRAWTPKALTLSHLLPVGLADVFLQAHSVMFTGIPDQNKLDDIKINLAELDHGLDTLLTVVRSILNQREIWDARQSAQFVMRAVDDYDKIKEIAELAKEQNSGRL